MATQPDEDERSSYSFRERVGESIRIEVGDDGIRHRSTTTGDTHLRWEDVAELALLSPLAKVVVCRVKPRQGKAFLFANRSKTSATAMRTQNGAFNRFTRELHRRAAEHSQIRFRAGNALWYWFAIGSLIVLGLMLLVLLGVVVWVAMAGKLRKAVPAYPLVTAAFVMPLLIHWAKKNKPTEYSGRAVPARLLAEIDGS